MEDGYDTIDIKYRTSDTSTAKSHATTFHRVRDSRNLAGLRNSPSRRLLRTRDQLRRADLVLLQAFQTIGDPRQTIRKDLDLVRL